MLLTDLQLNYKYRSEFHQIHKDFYEKCLRASIRYDRAAGYFTSASLSLLAEGLEIFIENQGKLRIVANPQISEKDYKAINEGYITKQKAIERSIIRNIEITARDIADNTLNILAWLISNNQLEIKIAYANNNSLYHEKFGIFEDVEGNNVGFSGSSNETVGGLKNNFEKIDVYTAPRDLYRIEDMKNDFEKLWDNTTNGLTVMDFPEIAKNMILRHKGKKPELKSNKENSVQLRRYQEDAILKLKENNWTGILEMATGTGKTITSLSAVTQYKNDFKRAFVIIIVPFKHLVDQWKDECSKFGYQIPTLCYESKMTWLNELKTEVINFNLNINDFHVVITTYKTANDQDFINEISKLQRNVVLIADECHYLGSSQFRKIKLENIKVRIGLSATPKRWWDDEGTNFLNDFFNGVVYEFTLETAITEGKLTPYLYHPHIIQMSELELNDYRDLTRRIINMLNKDDNDEEKLNMLYRRRALILSKAEGKIPKLIELLKKTSSEKISNTIVYCAETQVNTLTKVISDLGIRVHKFDSTVSRKERQTILQAFSNGSIQILVAIKCLDEGVDIPSTRVAYFLASTSNPREFIQRRGRILRKFKNKTLAEIHDFIVFPEDVDQNTFTMIASKELPRFAEFSSSAVNKSAAKNKLLPIISYNNLNHLFEMRPWDVYEQMKEGRSL